MKRILCAFFVLAFVGSPSAQADHRQDRHLEKSADRLVKSSEKLEKSATKFIDRNPRYWRTRDRRRGDARRAVFAIRRLAGSARAFEELVDHRRGRFADSALRRALESVRKDTHAVRQALERDHRQRWRRHRRVNDPFHRYVSSHLRPLFESLAEQVEVLSNLRLVRVRPHRRPTAPLEISELACPSRRKYTYRMEVCVEGRDLDRSRLRVVFAKRGNPDLDPWEREVTPQELRSSRRHRNGREERCYYLRQIGKDIRVHQGDQVYVVAERPNGRGRAVEGCWEDHVALHD
jgi:hypothetical protein